MPEEETIKDTLDVIRKALEEDENQDKEVINNNILLLDQLINEDGTIKTIENHKLQKKEILKILDNKLDEIFDLHLTKWLDKNVPLYLEKYFKNKKN